MFYFTKAESCFCNYHGRILFDGKFAICPQYSHVCNNVFSIRVHGKYTCLTETFVCNTIFSVVRNSKMSFMGRYRVRYYKAPSKNVRKTMIYIKILYIYIYKILTSNSWSMFILRKSNLVVRRGGQEVHV